MAFTKEYFGLYEQNELNLDQCALVHLHNILWMRSVNQTFSALIIFVSAAHAALFSKIKSGAHDGALFWKRERRSR